MAEQDRPERQQDGESGNAAAAFMALRDEIAAQHAALTALADQMQQHRKPPPDYTDDISRMVQAIHGLTRRLEALEAAPALARTALQHHRTVSEEAAALMKQPLLRLEDKAERLHTILKFYANRFLGARERKRQNWSVAANFIIGFLIGAWLMVVLPSQISDGLAARIATRVMDMDMAEAGLRMLHTAKPMAWRNYDFGYKIYAGNSNAIHDCHARMRYTGEAQTCTITIPTTLTRE